MTTVGICFLATSIGFVSIQTFLVAWFVKIIRTPTATSAASGKEYRVAIVLCIRGDDPSLLDCLRSMARQEHEKKKLIVVGDSESDPGLGTVRAFLADHPELESQVLVNTAIHDQCGLKCSNLIYALNGIKDQFDIIALIDADTHPPSQWLSQMISPFHDPNVQVTTGIRWFEPNGRFWGTWIRSIWNAAAIVQMVCYRIPWGGSLAIRSDFITKAEVLKSWSTGFCEDTMLQSLCAKQGGQVAVVPEAILPSSEQTTWRSCIPWISRQLLTTRLHHPKWPLVLGHGFFTTILSIVLPLNLIACILTGEWTGSLYLAVSYAIIQLGNYGLVLWILQTIRLKQRQISTENISAAKGSIFGLLGGIWLTQFAYPYAIIKTVFGRIVEWRQIHYRIRGKRIELIHYSPFSSSGASEKPSDGVSL